MKRFLHKEGELAVDFVSFKESYEKHFRGILKERSQLERAIEITSKSFDFNLDPLHVDGTGLKSKLQNRRAGLLVYQDRQAEFKNKIERTFQEK